MFRKPGRVVVGISGGADSLALFSVLDGLRKRHEYSLELVPVHIDQYGRHEEIDRLRAAVRQRFGVELQVHSRDTRKDAQSLLDIGKAPCRACAPIRSSVLGEVARSMSATSIALGHHLNDAASTLLMNILHRGEVDSMRPVGRRRPFREIDIVRPLYFCTEDAVKEASPFGSGGVFSCDLCSLHASERERTSKFIADTLRLHPPVEEIIARLLNDVAGEGAGAGGRRSRTPKGSKERSY